MVFLPNELLMHICTHLRHPRSPDDGPFSSRLSDGSQHTLASLCLTSKRFHAIAEPLLYLEMQPRGGAADGASTTDRLQDWNTQLRSFMYTLERRSDLAALVKRVTVNSFIAFPDGMKTQMWTHPLVTMDAIIRRLPNLEQYSLDFRGTYKRCDNPLYKSKHELDVFCAAYPQSFGARDSLADLMRSELGEEPWQPVTLSIDTLSLRMPNNLFRQYKTRLINPSRLSLEIDTLRIVQSDLRFMELEDILSSCVGLKSFIYEAARPSPSAMADPDTRIYQFDAPDVAEPLSLHQDTLEELHLDLRYGRYYPMCYHPLPGLAHFSALKTLLISASAVCAFQADADNAAPERLVLMLPPNLVSLNIVGCPGNALPCFTEMFLALAGYIQIGMFIHLKHITCSARSVFTQDLNDTFDTLAVAEAFAAVGVEFIYERPALDSRIFDDAEWMRPGAVLDADDEQPLLTCGRMKRKISSSKRMASRTTSRTTSLSHRDLFRFLYALPNKLAYNRPNIFPCGGLHRMIVMKNGGLHEMTVISKI